MIAASSKLSQLNTHTNDAIKEPKISKKEEVRSKWEGIYFDPTSLAFTFLINPSSIILISVTSGINDNSMN